MTTSAAKPQQTVQPGSALPPVYATTALVDNRAMPCAVLNTIRPECGPAASTLIAVATEQVITNMTHPRPGYRRPAHVNILGLLTSLSQI